MLAPQTAGHMEKPIKPLPSKTSLELVGTLVIASACGVGLFLLNSKPSCGSTAEATMNVQLVVTAHNHNCRYNLKIGQTFAIISSPEDPWGAWPPTMSNPALISDQGRSVGSPGPVWEFDYKAENVGDLVLEDEGITLTIRE
jgi:hypothetical protein